MITFKEFLVENTDLEKPNAVDDFHKEVDKHLLHGEIIKPQYEDLKRRVDRHVAKSSEAVSKEHLWGTGNKFNGTPLEDLAWSNHGSLNEVGSLKKKLDKAKASSDHPLHKALSQLHNTYSGLHAKMKELKGKIVTTTQKRAEAKEKKAVEQKKAFRDSSSLVDTLTQHLENFKDEAGRRAGENYDSHMKELEKHGWDINKAAPAPHSKMSREEYRRAAEKRHILTQHTDGPGTIRKPSDGKKALHIKTAKDNAHEDYMAWVGKLTNKIGKPVVDSKMSGNPWTGSHLVVKTHDGEEQHWHTQMIINHSRYGKGFNQFPTRRKK